MNITAELVSCWSLNVEAWSQSQDYMWNLWWIK